MRLRIPRLPFVCTVLLLILGASSASQTPNASSEEPTARFNADTTLVLIPATVTDRQNRFVLGLSKDDFHLFEDGVEQTITHFSGEDTPLSVGLVFDTSGSMGGKLRTSIRAVFQFLKTMNAQDEAFLIEFSDHVDLAVSLTSQFEDIQNKLSSIQPGGLTAMLDAAEMALGEMKKAKNPRKAILIISDGGDNNSRYSARELASLVREADVQIYAMGVFEPFLFPALTKEEVSGPRLLSQLAEQTGGQSFTASDPLDLPGVAARIGIELRNQYVLAYSPRNKDGKYHRVEVKVAEQPGIPNLKVRWRLGYYAQTR